jgi:hypothetical protein
MTDRRALYDPTHRGEVVPVDAVAVVHAFLERCQAWAVDREIPARALSLQESPTAEAAAKLHAWTIYRDFVAHTLSELEDGTLDHWFDEHTPGAPGRRR